MALTDYVQAYIGGLSGTVAWDINTLNFIVDETLEMLGVVSEAAATPKALHSVAKFITAQRLMVEFSLDYNYSADGESYSRAQAFEHVRQMYADAYTGATPYLPESEIEVGSLDFGNNPYNRSVLGNDV